jgi:hypothetical protein
MYVESDVAKLEKRLELKLVCDSKMGIVDCRTGTYSGHIYSSLVNMSSEDQCVFVSVVGLQVPRNVIRGSGTRLVAAFHAEAKDQPRQRISSRLLRSVRCW